MICSIVSMLAVTVAAPVPTPQNLPQIVVHAPRAALRVQVAVSPSQRERGLMGVTHLGQHTGMLFAFETDSDVAFWMKDTLIPLDMVFISPSGTVRSVFENVPIAPTAMPDDRIPLEQGRAKYVLELPAREAARDGIRAGSHVDGLPGARTP